MVPTSRKRKSSGFPRFGLREIWHTQNDLLERFFEVFSRTRRPLSIIVSCGMFSMFMRIFLNRNRFIFFEWAGARPGAKYRILTCAIARPESRIGKRLVQNWRAVPCASESGFYVSHNKTGPAGHSSKQHLQNTCLSPDSPMTMSDFYAPNPADLFVYMLYTTFQFLYSPTITTTHTFRKTVFVRKTTPPRTGGNVFSLWYSFLWGKTT
jgi:hypothetical protein